MQASVDPRLQLLRKMYSHLLEATGKHLHRNKHFNVRKLLHGYSAKEILSHLYNPAPEENSPTKFYVLQRALFS